MDAVNNLSLLYWNYFLLIIVIKNEKQKYQLFKILCYPAMSLENLTVNIVINIYFQLHLLT